jgi:hypothetical protein
VEQVLEAVVEADLTFTVEAATISDALRRAAAVRPGKTPLDVHIDPSAGHLSLMAAGPIGQPPRLRIDIPVTARGPALYTRIIPEHATALFTAAGAGTVSVRVNTRPPT